MNVNHIAAATTATATAFIVIKYQTSTAKKAVTDRQVNVYKSFITLIPPLYSINTHYEEKSFVFQ